MMISEMRKPFQLLALLVCAFVGHAVAAESVAVPEVTATDLVKEVAESYCKADFNGVPDIRVSLAKYSAKREAIEKAKDPDLLGKVIAFEADPILIVNSYQIQKITINKKDAVVTVAYDRLAKTKGSGLPGREIVSEHLNREVVELHLTNSNGQWLLLDPPLPRISKNALIQYYEDAIQRAQKWIHTDKASDAQRQSYAIMLGTLSVLKSL